MNPRVDFYFHKATRWQEALLHLRTIILGCGLTEELKWGVPCYTVEQRNVVLLHVFKDYYALLFLKGALLADARKLLIQQTQNTQATRQLRFTTVNEIQELAPVVTAYVAEAVAVEKAGRQVGLKKTSDFIWVAEFQQQITDNPALRASFYALTPGRQRAYLLYFAAPKQAATRAARVEKCRSFILEGKGLKK